MLNGNKLVSPLHGTECVYYRIQAWKEHVQGFGETATVIEMPVVNKADCVQAFVEDSNGRIEIELPALQIVEPDIESTWYAEDSPYYKNNRSDESHVAIKRFKKKYGSFNRLQKITESLLTTDWNYFVFGSVTTKSTGELVLTNSENGSLLSPHSESDVMSMLDKNSLKMRVKIVLACLALVTSVVVFVSVVTLLSPVPAGLFVTNGFVLLGFAYILFGEVGRSAFFLGKNVLEVQTGFGTRDVGTTWGNSLARRKSDIDAKRRASRQRFMRERKEFQSAMLESLCCVMAADGKATKAERSTITRILAKVGSPLSPQKIEEYFVDFVSRINEVGAEKTLDECLQSVQSLTNTLNRQKKISQSTEHGSRR